MWSQIDIPDPPAPIRAYTHIEDGVLFVCTTLGVFAYDAKSLAVWTRIAEHIDENMLFGEELVTYDEYGAIMFRNQYCPLHGYPSEESEGCSDFPRSLHAPTGDRLMYDEVGDRLLVVTASDRNQTKFVVEDFGAFDENWATAGFSERGDYLTVGSLASIRVFEYSPA